MSTRSTPAADLEARYEEVLSKLPSRAPIYLPTDKIPLPDKIRGVEHVLQIYRHDLDAIYRPRLRELRERFKNSKRCFLIGNGPSLNRTDLDMLKDEVTFAVNGFFLKSEELGWKPTFYLVEDHLVAEDRAAWINDYKGPIKLFPAYLGYMFDRSEDTIFYNHRPRKSYPHGFDFSLEADKITYTGCTVTFSMMQIAAYLGFEEIYLVGVDASYAIPVDATEGKEYGVGVLDMKSDDPNHFDPNYFGKGFRWHDPQVDKMIEAYTEARRTLEGTGQAIYNATVGGQLEVFERRDFNKIFPMARQPDEVERDKAARGYPKMLMLDMTAMGNGTATGEIKSNLTRDWPAERLLQLARHGKDGFALVRPDGEGGYLSEPASRASAMAEIEAFDPDVVMYRPVPNVSWLHEASMDIIRKLDKPLITWIMDDWPAELSQADPEQWAALEPDLLELLDRSVERLSICDAMSNAMERRYGVSFTALANGVDPADWQGVHTHEKRRLRIRYAGGLANNMTRQSVLRIARAVERIGEAGASVTFEVNTQKWWHREAQADFSGFKYTHLTAEDRSAQQYRDWLSRANVVVIAYNFDAETLRYTRYSMANKMPECLASGAVLFAHGPREAATIDYLADRDFACVVSEESVDKIEAALRELMNNPRERAAISRRAREFVFENHDISRLGDAFRGIAAKAVSDGSVKKDTADGGAGAIRPGLRDAPRASKPKQKAKAQRKIGSGTSSSGAVVYKFPEHEKADEDRSVLAMAAERTAIHLLRAFIVEWHVDCDATMQQLRSAPELKAQIQAAANQLASDNPLRLKCENALADTVRQNSA